jgi:hypothetical protein
VTGVEVLHEHERVACVRREMAEEAAERVEAAC